MAPHLASIAPGALLGELVPHEPGEAQELLAEGSPTDACPRGEAVIALHEDVLEEGGVPHEPIVDGVRYRDLALQPRLEAQPEVR